METNKRICKKLRILKLLSLLLTALSSTNAFAVQTNQQNAQILDLERHIDMLEKEPRKAGFVYKISFAAVDKNLIMLRAFLKESGIQLDENGNVSDEQIGKTIKFAIKDRFTFEKFIKFIDIQKNAKFFDKYQILAESDSFSSVNYDYFGAAANITLYPELYKGGITRTDLHFYFMYTQPFTLTLNEQFAADSNLTIQNNEINDSNNLGAESECTHFIFKGKFVTIIDQTIVLVKQNDVNDTDIAMVFVTAYVQKSPEVLKQIQTSAENLRTIGKEINSFYEKNNSMPKSLQDLTPFVDEPNMFKWSLENVRYLPQLSFTQFQKPDKLMIASDNTLQQNASGTNYLFADGHVEFLDISEAGELVEAMDQNLRQQESAIKLMMLGRWLSSYISRNNGKLPYSLNELKENSPVELYFIDSGFEYAGRGLNLKQLQGKEDSTPIAYDRKMLESGQGTNVLYLDGHVDFVNPEEFSQIWPEINLEKQTNVPTTSR